MGDERYAQTGAKSGHDPKYLGHNAKSSSERRSVAHEDRPETGSPPGPSLDSVDKVKIHHPHPPINGEALQILVCLPFQRTSVHIVSGGENKPEVCSLIEQRIPRDCVLSGPRLLVGLDFFAINGFLGLGVVLQGGGWR
ncbi:hypothetical protein Tco_0690330 [Tanacetum coccineum]